VIAVSAWRRRKKKDWLYIININVNRREVYPGMLTGIL
jgi:hypothetical protein